MLLNGILPPITTPFYSDERIYFKKLEYNVERYSKTPVLGLVVLGSNGETIFLSDEERREVLHTVAVAAAPEKVLVAGVGQESAAESLRLAEFAAKEGYDVALVRTPYYYRNQLAPANVLTFYRFLADRSPLPILLYNLPSATGYDLPAEIAMELASHPNILGIKESSGSLEKVSRLVRETRQIQRQAAVTEFFKPVTARMLQRAKESPKDLLAPAVALNTRQKEVGFQVLVGQAESLADSLEVGAAGAIIAFADAAPSACCEILAAFRERDLPLAQEKQHRVAVAANRIANEMGVPALKYAMDLNGYFGGRARLPMLPLTASQKLEIEQLMTAIRN